MKDLETTYSERHERVLLPTAAKIEFELKQLLKGIKHIDRIYARAKSIDRFLKKADKIEEGVRKYPDPINQIQDQIGARIITFYLEDVELVSNVIRTYYTFIERQNIFPDSEKEFGYEGKHFILLMPLEMRSNDIPKQLIPNFFELQIKTLFQHAFSEASHDLAYKPGIELSKDQKRKVAFSAAQAWGADLIFSELQKEIIV
jgi:ppGpp synthetase/RelA/SpoT-type nucleotidyltranferase